MIVWEAISPGRLNFDPTAGAPRPAATALAAHLARLPEEKKPRLYSTFLPRKQNPGLRAFDPGPVALQPYYTVSGKGTCPLD